MPPKKLLSWFRKIAIAEGLSFLILLGIAMPLKYFAGMPMAVKIVGSLHGGLFIAFIIFAWQVKNELLKDYSWLFKAFIASVVPFGTFLLDHQLKKEERALH